MIRLLTIQTKLKAPKSQFNAFGKYSYRNCEDILEALKPLLAETKTVVNLGDEVILIGDRYYVRAMASLLGEDGNKIGFSIAYAREEDTKKGMDGSQITGAASSYARKYALNGLFAIDDTRDADSNGVHAPSTSAAPKAATSDPRPPLDEKSQRMAALVEKIVTAPVNRMIAQPEDPRAEVGRLLLEMAGGDKEEAANLLEVLTTFTNDKGTEIRGKRSLHRDEMSDKYVKATLGKARDQHKKWLAAMDAPPPDEDDIPFEWGDDKEDYTIPDGA